jgi:hypothetical protein
MSMKPILKTLLDRRSFFKSTGTAAAGISLAGYFSSSEDVEAATQNVNKASKPSELKITDLRVATLRGVPFTSPLIRIDTNQGIYGLGEVRDGASKNYALMLKSRLLGENPCNVDKVFRKQAVWKPCASGWGRVWRRDGLVGSGGKGIRRSCLPDARRQVP